MQNLSKEGLQELRGHIIDAINDGRLDEIEVSEIHQEVFNTDYFIIGRYEAKKWLENNYGVFEAIEKIREYEQFNFGEVNTDFSEPENVVNMLVYILGEEILSECETISDNWDNVLDENLKSELLKELEG